MSRLPRPQALLLGRARCALDYGIVRGSQGVVGSCSASEPSSLAPPVFPPYRLLPKSAWGRADVTVKFLTILNIAASQRQGLFKVKVYSQDGSFLGETEILYLDVVEEVLKQAVSNRTIMKKFMMAAIPCLDENSEGISLNTQSCTNVGMFTFLIVHVQDVIS